MKGLGVVKLILFCWTPLNLFVGPSLTLRRQMHYDLHMERGFL